MQQNKPVQNQLLSNWLIYTLFELLILIIFIIYAIFNSKTND